jgi:hypothetical protein
VTAARCADRLTDGHAVFLHRERVDRLTPGGDRFNELRSGASLQFLFPGRLESDPRLNITYGLRYELTRASRKPSIAPRSFSRSIRRQTYFVPRTDAKQIYLYNPQPYIHSIETVGRALLSTTP